MVTSPPTVKLEPKCFEESFEVIEGDVAEVPFADLLPEPGRTHRQTVPRGCDRFGSVADEGGAGYHAGEGLHVDEETEDRKGGERGDTGDERG